MELYFSTLLCCVVITTAYDGIPVKSSTEDDPLALQRLYKTLFEDSNYNKFVLPKGIRGTSVNCSLSLTSIRGLDEENAIISMDVMMRMTWEDERLRWNPRDFKNATLIRVPNNHLWNPDIVLYNGPSEHSHLEDKRQALVYKDGKVVWMPFVKFVYHCPQNTDVDDDNIRFCKAVIGSWTYDGFSMDLNLESNSVDTSSYQNSHPKWELIKDKISARKIVTYYPCCEEPYLELEYAFGLQKKEANKRIPCAVKGTCLCVAVLCLSSLFLGSVMGSVTIKVGLLLVLAVILVPVSLNSEANVPGSQAGMFVCSVMATVTSVAILEIITASSIISVTYRWIRDRVPKSFSPHSKIIDMDSLKSDMVADRQESMGSSSGVIHVGKFDIVGTSLARMLVFSFFAGIFLYLFFAFK